ncbi:MAG: thioredoxin domain-containing protein [Acidobacteria bacterium]|nr:thioredoxin domain-containing protein [Acidobacteriota bacterium]
MTLNDVHPRRIFSFFTGIGMAAASLLTIQHFFLANYPESIFEGSFCDISAFFNCDSSAFSEISQVLGIPLGFFGLVVGLLVSLGVLFPTEKFERTNGFIAFGNVICVLALLVYSILVMGSLCLLCSGYYLFSILSFFLFWRYGVGRKKYGVVGRLLRPSFKMLVVFACFTALAGAGVMEYHNVKRNAQEAVSMRIVRQFYELPVVGNPSFISPYWTVRSTGEFEDAAIHIIEYSDFLCPDCLFLTQQLNRLKEEFAGKINIAFQFFPLEGKCNTVVAKDIHPGACELTAIAAYDPARFVEIHDEIFANFNLARNPGWREDLARRFGAEGAADNPYTMTLIQTIVETGREYEKTSDQYDHGIRSTPTMILNGRMIIGTLPYEHLQAICRALVEEHEGGRRFIENWVPGKARR